MKTLTVLLSLALLGSSSSSFGQSACEQIRITPPFGETTPESFGGAVATNGRWAFFAQDRFNLPPLSPGWATSGVDEIAEAGAVFAYAWSLDLGEWVYFQTITSPDPFEGEQFGLDIDATPRHLIVSGQGTSYAYKLVPTGAGSLSGDNPLGQLAWGLDAELSTGDGGQFEVATADWFIDQVPSFGASLALISVGEAVDVWDTESQPGTAIGGSLSNWSLRQTLEPFGVIWGEGGITPGDFGKGMGAVDAYAEFVVVGASRTDVSGLNDAGAVYVYRRNADGIYQSAQLLADPTPSSNARLGRWTTLGLVAGVTTLFATDLESHVHMFHQPNPGGNFVYVGELPMPVGATGFGQGLVANGNDLIVSATGMTGIENLAGIAFHYIDGVFEQQHVTSDADSFHGTTMTDLWGNVLVRGRTRSFVGTGDKSAYVVRITDFDSMNIGGGVAGLGDFTPTLAITECPAFDHDFSFEVSNGLGGAVGAIAISMGFPDGVMSSNGGLFFPRQPLIVFSMHTLGGVGAGNGSTEVTLGLMPDLTHMGAGMAGLISSKFVGQCLYLDSSVPAGYTQTNAVQLTMRQVFDFEKVQ